MTLALRIVALAAAASLGSCAAFFAPDPGARAPALEGYGRVDMAMTTRVPAARLRFADGMAQVYAFDEEEAARQFKAALALDPGCTLCAWGVAKAIGPDINHPDRRDTAEARRYLRWAERHGEGATPRERALVEAMLVRFGDAPPKANADATTTASTAAGPVSLPAALCSSGGTGSTADPRDVAYAAKMRALVDAYPDDADLVSLWAEAEMIATADDWWDRTSGKPAGEIGAVADRLERALAKAPDHPGLNHFMIHAVDASPAPQRALAAADRLGPLAPASPHLLHMPSHIYVNTGRLHDATEVNLAAVAAEDARNASLEAQGFAPGVDWYGHDRQFLWFAALTEGRGELALAQARALATRAAKGTTASAEFARSGPLLTLLRLEHWDELRAEPPVAGDVGVAAAARTYANGVADARTGRLDAARTAAAALRTAQAAPALASAYVYGDKAGTVLDIWSRRLDAELAVAERRGDDAATAMARAVELEGALESNEPPMLGAFSRVAQGELLRRVGRASDAEGAERAELKMRPGNAWALAGLQASLAAQGRGDDARQARGDAERALAAADPGVRAALLR